MVAPGTAVTKTATAVGTKPRWMEWENTTTLGGDAELPSGSFKLATLNGTVRTDEFIDVDPVVLPDDNRSPWRCIVYAPDGSYILMDGLGGIPTVGTPAVRLTRSAPSKAVVRIPIGRGADNILSESFAKWSDGNARPVTRGMEITVEYRDDRSGALRLAFRGRIFQIQSGEVITLTAYDRLMDLYQTTGQYLSHAGNTQGVRTYNRTFSDPNYIYETGIQLGIITGIDSINRIVINASGSMGIDYENTSDIIIHGLPTAGGITPSAGDIISRVQVKYGGKIYGYTQAGAVISVAKIAAMQVNCDVYIFEKVGSGFIQRATGHTAGTTKQFTSTATASVSYSLEDENLTGDVTLNTPVTITDPSNIYIGVKVYLMTAFRQAVLSSSSYGANRSSARLTTGGVAYYRSSDGSTWSSYTPASKPEMGITFTHVGSSISPSSATISGGSRVVIPQGSIPAGPSATYLWTDGAGATGVGIVVDYYEADKAPLSEIVGELLEGAGLKPDIGNTVDLGLVTLYLCTTTDYLTAIQDIIKSRGYGIRDTLALSGRVSVLPEHTVDENPIAIFTTSPSGVGDRAIVDHSLTVHWASEKATVAYIAENATSSGLPLALETDDLLMDDSLAEALQVPMSAVTVDNTLGTHDMMAVAAGGAIRRLHTNTVEGTVSLAGYHTEIWDLEGSGVGGLPIRVIIPEYEVDGTVIPTEMEIRDGTTIIQLDNIRSQDRSGVARSMGIVEGTVSNDASMLPKSVYAFGRADDNNQLGGVFGSLNSVTLVRQNGTTVVQSSQTYLKSVTDTAGYRHLLAVFPMSGGTYTSASPVVAVQASVTAGGTTKTISALINTPKYIVDNQNIHVDLRVRNI